MSDLLRRSSYALLALLLLAGCGDDPVSDPPAPEVDVEALFAPPTAAERQQVRAQWAARDVSVEGYRLEATGTALGHEVRIVSHTVGGVRHYGALVIVGDNPAPSSLPVVVYAHGGDAGVDVVEAVTVLTLGYEALGDDVVLVIPSYRGEDVRFDGQAYQSGGPPSPWDLDVDDTLALLNVARETVEAAQSAPAGIFGFSRGGGVALLAAIREPDLQVVVDYFGPTDFFGPYVQEIVDEAIAGTPRNLPGLDYLNETFVEPLIEGMVTVEDVRLELLRRSPVYFAEDLPDVQAHHGEADATVAVSQTQALIDAMAALGRTGETFEGYLYPGAGHNPFDMPASFERASAFLERLRVVPVVPRPLRPQPAAP